MIERSKLMFEDQIDAGQKLFEMLPVEHLRSEKYTIVCGSLNSVFLVNFIAKKLRLDFEIIFNDFIFAPNNADCVVAMVSETEEIVMIDELIKSFGISLDYIYGESHRKYEERILKNVYKYRKGKLLTDLKDKNVILIDEGCETGITALMCAKTLINLGVKSIIYATPLIAKDVADSIINIIDEIYYVHKIVNFVNVNFYYRNKILFNEQIVMDILEDSPYYLPLQREGEKVCNTQ